MENVRYGVRGLAEVQRGLRRVDTAAARELSRGLKELAIPIRDEVRDKAGRFGPDVARKIRARVSRSVAIVDTSARKSSDLSKRRPNFASELYEAAFDHALLDRRADIEIGAHELLRRIAGNF